MQNGNNNDAAMAEAPIDDNLFMNRFRDLRVLQVVKYDDDFGVSANGASIESGDLRHDLELILSEIQLGTFTGINFFTFCVHRNFSFKNMKDIFRAVCTMSKKLSFHFCNEAAFLSFRRQGEHFLTLPGVHVMFPAQLMAVLCQSVQQIGLIYLEDVYFDGSVEGFKAWATAMEGISSIDCISNLQGGLPWINDHLLDGETIAITHSLPTHSKWDKVILGILNKDIDLGYDPRIVENGKRITLSPETSRVYLGVTSQNPSHGLSIWEHENYFMSPFILSLPTINDVASFCSVCRTQLVGNAGLGNNHAVLNIRFQAEPPHENPFINSLLQQNEVPPPKFHFLVRDKSQPPVDISQAKRITIKMKIGSINPKAWFQEVSSKLRRSNPNLTVAYKCTHENEKSLYLYKAFDEYNLWNFDPLTSCPGHTEWAQIIAVLGKLCFIEYGETVEDVSPLYSLLSSDPGKVVGLLTGSSTSARTPGSSNQDDPCEAGTGHLGNVRR